MKITRDAIVSAGLFAMRAGSVVTTSAARAVVLAAVAHLGTVAHAQADFEGIWVSNTPIGNGAQRDRDRYLTPAGQAEWDSFSAASDPSFRCIAPGVPRGLSDPYPVEFIQQEHQIVMLREYYHQVRRFFMDGREAPEYWPLSVNGYSTGHWEGETLVVRTTHLSPDNLMDIHGHPFSGAEDTYAIERYTRSGNLLNMTADVHDPTYYEEPFRFAYEWKFDPDGEIWEYECDPRFGDVGPQGEIQGGTEGGN